MIWEKAGMQDLVFGLQLTKAASTINSGSQNFPREAFRCILLDSYLFNQLKLKHGNTVALDFLITSKFLSKVFAKNVKNPCPLGNIDTFQ
jgi:hypothetical protein